MASEHRSTDANGAPVPRERDEGGCRGAPAALPIDALDRAVGEEPAAARRTLRVFGRPVTLAWLPARSRRGGIPTATAPAFRPERARRILREEALWEDRPGAADLVLTPNRFPFAARQALLWTTRVLREPPHELWATATAFVDARGGDTAALWNSVGAAASIPRAHVHLVAGTENGFLADAPTTPWPEHEELFDGDGFDGLAVSRLDLPVLVVRVEGPSAVRARAVARLLELRTTPAANAVVLPGVSFVAPRSAVEIPQPHFPHALGSAELVGRWCYAEREAFDAARAEDLERALTESLLGVG
jgi:hypothetical protein